MKIAIFCSYFPPDQSVGVRRIVSLANYLADMGEEVIVVTPYRKGSNECFDGLSHGIRIMHVNLTGVKEVSRGELNDSPPVNGGRFVGGWLHGIAKSLKRRYVNKIFGQMADLNLIYIPAVLLSGDVRRIARTSVCISTTPSWASHLTVYLLKLFDKNINYVLDYRDPFSDCHLFAGRLSFLERKLDQLFCGKASAVASVSPSWVKMLSKYTASPYLIRNGYDRRVSKIPNNINFKKEQDDVIRIGYFGSINHVDRLPVNLLSAANFAQRKVELHVYGEVSYADEVMRCESEYVRVVLAGSIPYSKVLSVMMSMDVNYIQETLVGDSLSTAGVIPTKVYEYVGAALPIISSVSVDGDSLSVLNSSGLLLRNCIGVNDFVALFGEIYGVGVTLCPDVNFIESCSREHSNRMFRNILHSVGLGV